VGVDCSAALGLEGVAAVVTAADIPGRNLYGIIVKDQPFLAVDRVRYVGEAVAAVAADTVDIAEQALDLIRVDYEPLPAVFDPLEAMEPDAPVVLGTSNVRLWRKVRRGDTEQVFAAAPVVVEGTFRTQLVEHAYIEPEAGLAVPGEGELTLHCVSQGVHYNRGEIAAMLGWPVGRVRVVQTMVGGGFGGKIDLSVHPFIALLAVKTGRPVKLVYTREESMQASTKRHPFVIRMRFAADHEGRLLAGEAHIVGDTGAYASYGHAVMTRAAASAFGPYNVGAVKVDAYMVHTNNPIAGAMRGFGVPQMATAYEQLMDMLAEKVGLTPLEIRRRNGWRPGHATTATGQELSGGVAVLETLERAAAGSRLSDGGVL
jgi:CO/xanthine dehydrogenase Mo-binding subunit